MLVKKLNDKKILECGDYTEINKALLLETTKYCLYPKDWQYTEITHVLLARWPHLTSFFRTEKDGRREIQKKINHHFKNTRCRKYKGDKLFEETRRKYKKTGGGKTSARNFRGVHLFSVDAPEGEDERTIPKHIDRLKEQFYQHPLKRNPEQICFGMAQTLHHRRELILLKKPVAEIISFYPLLGEKEELLREIGRICPSFDILNSFDSFVRNNAAKLERINISQVKLTTDVIDYINVMQAMPRGTYNRGVAAIFLVSIHLQEKVKDFFRDSGEAAYPQIELGYVGDDGLKLGEILAWCAFKVRVEGVVVASTSSLLEAFSLMYGCYYVFNLEYPKKIGKDSHIFSKIYFKFT